MRGFWFTIGVIAAALCTAPAWAAISFGTGVAGTNYSPAGTWTSSTAGYIGYHADGTMTVDTGSAQFAQYGYIGGAPTYTTTTGTAIIDGMNGSTSSSWTISGSSGAGGLYVGYYGTGNLKITNGGKVTGSGVTNFIAHQPNSTGTATVNGVGSYTTHPASLWTTGGTLTIANGANSHGYLNITNGGNVTGTGASIIANGTGSTGLVTVNGMYDATHPSTWTVGGALTVGNAGTLATGTLTITNGGYVNAAANNITIGAVSGGTGTVNVNGTHPTFAIASKLTTTTGYIYVGTNGTGNLNVTNGGQVTLGPTAPFAVATGNNSTGTVTISNGGAMTTGTAYIGSNAIGSATGMHGEVFVDGGTSSWTLTGAAGTPTALYVGRYARLSGTNGSAYGKLHITNGATVYNTYISTTNPVLSGATIIGVDAGYIGGASSGTLDLTGGGTLNTRSLLAVPSQMLGTGTINTKGLVTDGAVTINGVLNPTYSWTGADSGTVTVNLDMTTAANNGVLGAGYADGTGTSTLTISNGVQVASSAGYIGYKAGSKGTVNVSGANTKWLATSTSGRWYVGYAGNGTLNVNGGATLDLSAAGANGILSFAYASNQASGTANFDGAGTTAIVYQPFATDYAYGPGYLNITNGAQMTASGVTTLGTSPGGPNYLTVDGAGSSLSGTTGITVSRGNMLITNGAHVTTTGAVSSGSAGYFLHVDGAGSQLTSGAGNNNAQAWGRLYVSGGGQYNTASWTNWGQGMLQVDAGRNSSVNVSGTLTNSGFNIYSGVRVACGASPTAGSTSTPVTAGTWTAGNYFAVGGTWDVNAADGTGTHVFTASTVNAVSGTGGITASIDTSVQQRMLLTDTGVSKSLGASFMATGTSTPIGLTASYGAPGTPPAHLLSAWTFSSVGYVNDPSAYTSGDSPYLSLSVTGAQYGFYADTPLSVYSYDGTNWTAYAAGDLTFDGNYASFGATSLAATGAGSGYAVTGIAVLAGDTNFDKHVDINDLGKVLTNYDKTGMKWADGDFDGNGKVDINDLGKVLTNYDKVASAAAGIHAVPEPGTLALLVAGLAGLVAFAWRKRG